MTYDQQVETSVRADDLEDLLEHIAWANTVEPALAKYKETYHNLLVQSVLGQAVTDRTTGLVVSKEMLAGRISGIEWITRYMTNVLNRGKSAKSVLEDLYLQ